MSGFALGSMIGGFDPSGLLRLMDAVEVCGIDAMSTGMVLAWTTEALEKGIVTERKTDGLRLRTGARHSHLDSAG